MRKEDSDKRIYYSIINTFLGRMCLSGDIYNLSTHQWKLIEDGISFYHRIIDIIKYGKTIQYENDVKSYNKPQGEQIVIRQFANELLAIVHKFENSKDINLNFLKDYEILQSYGKLEGDFSAMAWLLKSNKE